MPNVYVYEICLSSVIHFYCHQHTVMMVIYFLVFLILYDSHFCLNTTYVMLFSFLYDLYFLQSKKFSFEFTDFVII